MNDAATITALWWAVIASGLYHGLNPGMGWPLAVSAALMRRSYSHIFKALLALGLGHFLAMTAILLPFSAMLVLVRWQWEIRLAAACLVIAMGCWLLINRRHPRFLSRIPPSRLALWSFLVAMAHGAGLMLVPIYLGLCNLSAESVGHSAAATLMGSTISAALGVAIVHTSAMIVAGGSLALGVYYWLGLKFLSRSWFNLDLLWALSLIFVGAVSLLALR